MTYKKPRLYALHFEGATVSPNDATDYFVGNIYGLTIAGSWSSACACVVPATGTIRRAFLSLHASTNTGSNENIVAVIRKNNTTDYTFATVGTATAQRDFINNNLNIPVTAGDTLEFKFTTPTWADNPTGVRAGGQIYIEAP